MLIRLNGDGARRAALPLPKRSFAASEPAALLWTRGRKVGIGSCNPPRTNVAPGVGNGGRDVAHLFLHALIAIERFVAGRIRRVIADVAAEARLLTGSDQSHPVEPL